MHRKVSPVGGDPVVDRAISPVDAGESMAGESKGMTQHGSPSAFWLYASKPVGGEDRQIRPLSFNPEQRV